MKADTLPPWQRSSSSEASEIERYALIELSHLPVSARTALFNELVQDSHYWPLVKDESQPHLQREGPWVLQVRQDKLDKLLALDGIVCALQGWIESPLTGTELASHLAPAMAVENPQKQRSLLRFYLPDVITQLHKDALDNPANALFLGVTRWWYRDATLGWTALEGKALPESLPPWQLTVDEARWQSLHGEPEVMQLTAELVDFSPSLFEGVCLCERPRQVAKALMQANNHGLTAIADKRTFVYVQLSQGSDAWASDDMQSLLQRASGGEATLADLLTTTYQQTEEC
ncbi:DUF4123 domain-containing protein [Vreelandella nigrificans]|uniref:DUF4123 domain-containing protein n=1 Tax=Vreelandella nigrificans TaxID=2042704 RepID=A0A2A4HFU7_9GAMM|nr:DUF4123 domain-containing protein [Halomonas nigrificans]PCF93460.1 hypothetical protein CPA45_22210 [Halomonas nigrificans]